MTLAASSPAASSTRVVFDADGRPSGDWLATLPLYSAGLDERIEARLELIRCTVMTEHRFRQMQRTEARIIRMLTTHARFTTIAQLKAARDRMRRLERSYAVWWRRVGRASDRFERAHQRVMVTSDD